MTSNHESSCNEGKAPTKPPAKKQAAKKSINWIITRVCNYRCAYCFAEGKDRTTRSHSNDAVVDGVLEHTQTLGDSWLVKLNGGEPTLHPRFLEICRTLAQQNHRIGMTSNFSWPREKL